MIARQYMERGVVFNGGSGYLAELTQRKAPSAIKVFPE